MLRDGDNLPRGAAAAAAVDTSSLSPWKRGSIETSTVVVVSSPRTKSSSTARQTTAAAADSFQCGFPSIISARMGWVGGRVWVSEWVRGLMLLFTPLRNKYMSLHSYVCRSSVPAFLSYPLYLLLCTWSSVPWDTHHSLPATLCRPPTRPPVHPSIHWLKPLLDKYNNPIRPLLLIQTTE